ncbi:hypothetical protein EJ110_NYTH16501 [Nymphaea thermarum]|nr:hypothetical protein EJ110_NYTH16501 [Nymphaea thermarum]
MWPFGMSYSFPSRVVTEKSQCELRRSMINGGRFAGRNDVGKDLSKPLASTIPAAVSWDRELSDPQSFCEEPKLFLPDRVIDIKDNTRPKSRYVELVHLLLAKIRLWRLKEVSRHFGTDKKRDFFVQEIHGEDIAKPIILFPDHYNRALHEFQEPSNKRKRLNCRGSPLLRTGEEQRRQKLRHHNRC